MGVRGWQHYQKENQIHFVHVSEWILLVGKSGYLQQKRDILQRFKLSRILASALSCA